MDFVREFNVNLWLIVICQMITGSFGGLICHTNDI